MLSHDQVFLYNNIGRYIYRERVIEIAMTKIKFERIADIYQCAYVGDWSEMEPIVANDPDSVLIRLTGSGDTALHVAAAAGNTTFVEELTKLMKPKEQLIPNSDGMLAVHLAALSRHHRIVKHFCSGQYFFGRNSYPLLDEMGYKDRKKLFFMTIDNDMFGKCIYKTSLFTPSSYLIIFYLLN